MADATVICSIERLFDWEPPGEAVVGVTLSMAWGNPTKAPPDKLLLPWNWLLWPEGPEKLGFCWACYTPADITIVKFSPTAVSPQPLMRNGRTISSVRKNGDYQDFTENCVRPRYDQIRKKLTNLGYPQNGQDHVTVTASPTDGAGDASQYASGARWPSILADLSTRPAPIPHALLLAFVFKLGKISDLLPKRNDGSTPTVDDCNVLIAPVLNARATGKASDTNPVSDPAAKPLSSTDDSITVLWSYSDTTYQASCQTVALGAAPAPKSFFDMASRLVLAPQNEKWHFNEDWQSSFESRLADRLDVSAELLRILENESFDDATARNVADAAIAALRDVAGIGLDSNPGNISFLGTQGVDPATISAIRKALPSNANFKDVTGWKTFLKAAFATPETTLTDSNLAAFDLWGTGPVKSTEASRQLSLVRQKILAPDALWALFQLQVSSLAPSTNLKQPAHLDGLPATLRDENLGRYWRSGLLNALASPAGTYSADAVRLALTNKMQAMTIARFSDPTFFPGVSPDVAKGAMAALKTKTSQADWTAAAKYAIPEAASSPSTAPGASAATLAAQGITIQVNELGDTANLSVPGSEAEEIRKMQGVALLLGHNTDANGSASTIGYNCLNYADACYSSPSGAVSKTKILERAALVPLRFTWRNGVAVATVSYNNEPLSAPGPLSRAAKLVSPGGQTSDVSVGTDLLWYSYPTNETPGANAADARTQLTALIYGRDYHPQPFLVSNSGVLPKLLATNYLDLKWGDQLDKTPLIGKTWDTISYRRQQKPGALRLANIHPGTEKYLKLPAIPQGVFPRVQSQDNDQPLVMLVPDQNRFTTDLPPIFEFNVRPPATDLLTWDRFVNGFGNGLANARSTVFTGFLSEVRQRSDKTDITIDDPATVYSGYDCSMYFELLDEDGTQINADFVSFPKPTGSGLSSVQASSLTVSLVAATDTTKVKSKPPTIDVKPSKLTVTVFEGRFARLRLHACVHKDYADRFEPSLLASVGTLNGDYYLLHPTEILIEVVTDGLPLETELFDVQKFRVGEFNIMDGTATVTLDLAGITSEQYVYSAEVLRQVWRWQGRPVQPLPSTGDLSPEWLTREFGTRDQADFLRAPMAPPDLKSRTFTFTEERGSLLSDADRASANLPRTVSQISVSAESRLLGTYIRYGVQAESRYKPVLLNNSYVRGKGVDGSLWRNLYIPSRKLSQIKAPNVKLVLPLTRNAVAPQNGPGILVMIRGPWFQECGLGERLEARIMLVETPEENPSSTTSKTVYYQYGSDPILKNPVKLPSVLQDKAQSGWDSESSTITGPVGHTFDTVSSGQLFLNTSFVLNYPTIGKLSWIPWAFCQIQVRRVVDVMGKPSVAVSDWSPPTWIQLLPDFDRYSADGKFADLTLRLQSAMGNFQLVDSSNQPVTITAGNGDPIYANYLAVTHFVSDATGKLIQETYDGLYRQSGENWVRLGNAPPASVQSVCRARVLTVQGKNPAAAADEDTFWGDVFSIETHPGDPASSLVQDIDRLRIVSASRPIDMANSPFRGC